MERDCPNATATESNSAAVCITGGDASKSMDGRTPAESAVCDPPKISEIRADESGKVPESANGPDTEQPCVSPNIPDPSRTIDGHKPRETINAPDGSESDRAIPAVGAGTPAVGVAGADTACVSETANATDCVAARTVGVGIGVGVTDGVSVRTV
jgi:hypothetical protein